MAAAIRMLRQRRMEDLADPGMRARNAATFAAVADRRACDSLAPSKAAATAAARRQSRMPPRIAIRSITELANCVSLVAR